MESDSQMYNRFQISSSFRYYSILPPFLKVSLVGLVCDKDFSKVTEVRFSLDDGTSFGKKLFTQVYVIISMLMQTNCGLHRGVLSLYRVYTLLFKNSESQLGQQAGDVTQSQMVNSSVNTNLLAQEFQF
ncbi:hypothetical protein Bca4012_010118 [Brassica carinata]